MPASIPDDSADSSKSPTRGGDKEKEKASKAKAVAANTKGKDLSHVPCKFFRVGQCTAGASCVFSHHVAEPGEIKETCTWFVKGNCKFGHKCALAHILPGQPMSMDRKNKKAAQQQAQSTNGATKEKEGKKEGGKGTSGKERQSASALTSRLAPSGLSRPPMAISKATMSPSAPAPALRDTDFAFGSLDDMIAESAEATKSKDVSEASPSTATAWRKETITSSASSGGAAPALTAAAKEDKVPTYAERVTGEVRKPSPLPLSTPSVPRGFTSPNGAPTIDFGPVGSPPRHSPISGGLAHPSPTRFPQNRPNGLSPGASPTTQRTNETPFSAPLVQTIYNQYTTERPPSNDFSQKPPAGMAASLGPNMLMGSRAWDIQGHSRQLDTEDDDIEDFLPSSLNELLTPAERKRRESRSNGIRPNLETHHHRHSRSVPALSLMDNMMGVNIWSEERPSPTIPSSVNNRSFAPSSFGGNDGLSGTILGTSNVSAGFLSSLHPPRPGISARSVSDTRPVPPPASNQTSKPSSFNNARFAYEPSTYGVPPNQNPDALLSGLGQLALSPSARALQSHAPGTSLPQGLAAGYSRMHARPNSILSALSPPSTAGLEEGIQNVPPIPGMPRIPDRSLASKQPSLARRTPLQGISSPLSGPVISNEMDQDDDELFPIDIGH